MKRKIFIFWSLFLAVFLFRFTFSLYAETPDIGVCEGASVTGHGRVVEDPSVSESAQILVVSATYLRAPDQDCPTDLRIRLKTKLYPRLLFGSSIDFSGKLNVPRNFSSDDNSGRVFDYRGYLAKDDIYFEIKSASVTATSEQGSGIFVWLSKIKRGFVNNLQNVLGEPHSALAAGLVVGEKSALGKGLLSDFRMVGLIHIVVLSGFNITIVADAIRRVLAFLPRVWGIVLGGVGIFLFGTMVGGGATVVRSCLMAAVALFAELIRREYNVVMALSFAGLVMLIINPKLLLHDPSFQLSFLATLGLLLLATPLQEKMTFVTEKFGIRGIVASTLATQIFVSPYLLYMVGQISLIGLVVNILVLPFIPVTMLMVFLCGSLGFLSPYLSVLAGWGAHFLLGYELFMVKKFAQIPYASLHFPVFSFFWVVAFYLLFFIWRSGIVERIRTKPP